VLILAGAVRTSDVSLRARGCVREYDRWTPMTPPASAKAPPGAPSGSPGVAACRYHPDREAIGVCVACRTRVCGACVTKVEGVNHCATCLETLAAEGARGPIGVRRVASARDARAVGAAYLAALSVAAWLLLHTLLPGG
jgi:hypothetical protein